MTDAPQGPGWWLASDGKWYPPQAPSGAVRGHQWAHQPIAPPRRTNPFAVAALVCGVVWAGGLLSILAVIFGAVALADIRKRDEGGKGLAVAGLVLGGVGILGIVAIVAVSGGSSSSSRHRDTDAIVHIEATPDVCWTATLRDSGTGRAGGVTRQGCGNAFYDMGIRSDRKVIVTKRSGPGAVGVVINVGSAEVGRATTAQEGRFIILAAP